MPFNSQFKTAFEAAKKVSKAAKRLENVNLVLEAYSDCVYVKGPAGKLIAANAAYTRLFGRGQSTLGRDVKNFLDDITSSFANLSDQLVLQGSPYVIFEHEYRAKHGNDSKDRIRLCTVKVSLLDEAIVNHLCLGYTRVLGPLPHANRTQISQAWQRLERLEDRLQKLAVLVAKGMSQAEMARQLEVSLRTVNADVQRILDAFEVDNLHELSRLLARVQDSGYIDLGL